MSSRTHVLGLPLDVLTAEELREHSFLLLSSQQAHQVITANALLAMQAQTNSDLLTACLNASLMLPESSGIRWAIRRQKISTSRVAGIDYAWQLCELCAENNWSIYLLGGSADVLEAARLQLQNSIPQLRIVGSHDGFFDINQTSDILRSIRELRPHLTLVALGMPKQDIWIAQHLSQLPPGLYMGVGGSFDVWAGRLKRAPFWMRKLGAEWFYRLCQEPRRWQRMLDLPRFALRVLCREKKQSDS